MCEANDSETGGIITELPLHGPQESHRNESVDSGRAGGMPIAGLLGTCLGLAGG